MKRSLMSVAAVAMAMALVSSPVSAQNAPVVTVLSFDNGAFGPGAHDYDGIGKGLADALITDLASNTKVRVVDRERVQAILDEQKLAADGRLDGTTAVRVGKLLGACYSIYGTFMRDQKTGDNIVTIHTTSNETGQIQNAQKIQKKGDDIMGLIAEASAKFISTMDVKACPGGMTRSASAAPAQQGATPASAPASAPAAAPAATPAASAPVTYSKPLSESEQKKFHESKIDARTMLLYSRALDAKDHKDKAKATELLKQVLAKAPNYYPAEQALKSL